MKYLLALFLGLAVCAAVTAQGMKDMPMKDHPSRVHKASGKVTKVDPAKGTVTIAHGPVASINWPSMTMAFKARDKAMLDKVKPGDNIEFSFTSSGKDYVITDMK
jgi:Cu(I)/Ag(I) efflux system periplasmic protein CusF